MSRGPGVDERWLDEDAWPALPEVHGSFLRAALPRLPSDERLLGVAAGGSFLSGEMDEQSDLDLVVVTRPESRSEVMAARTEIAEGLGSLLAAFTGEHVGEPRLLICLYGPPLLHVDLKFVTPAELDDRSEDPVVLWERGGQVTAGLGRGRARVPELDLQWIEDRFWIWVHYGSGKIARGELFEALDMLGFVRGRVTGPLALVQAGARPSGVRRVERRAPSLRGELAATVGRLEPRACAEALHATVRLYRRLRDELAPPALERRSRAEVEVVRDLEDLLASLPTSEPGESGT